MRRLPSLLLAILIGAPLVGFLPRVLGERTPEPLDARPTWAQLVVITANGPPEPDALRQASFEQLAAGAARAAVLPEPDERASAAALWTGRAPAGGPPLPPGSWTLALAARRSGASTAAFLRAPLVSALGLEGFDSVVEQPEQSPGSLAAHLERHLAEHTGQRSTVWLHVADGPLGPEVEAALAALERQGHAHDALVLVTSLTSGGEEPTPVPLWARLPSALYAGRQGAGSARLTDVAGVLLQVLRLPAPDVTRGEAPVQSTPDLATLLQGGSL